jgi:hypothetical protein
MYAGFVPFPVHVTLGARELSRVTCSGNQCDKPLTESALVESLLSGLTTSLDGRYPLHGNQAYLFRGTHLHQEQTSTYNGRYTQAPDCAGATLKLPPWTVPWEETQPTYLPKDLTSWCQIRRGRSRPIALLAVTVHI